MTRYLVTLKTQAVFTAEIEAPDSAQAAVILGEQLYAAGVVRRDYGRVRGVVADYKGITDIKVCRSPSEPLEQDDAQADHDS